MPGSAEPDDNQSVGRRFGSPDFAGPAEKLADVAARESATEILRMSRCQDRIATPTRSPVKSVNQTRSVSST